MGSMIHRLATLGLALVWVTAACGQDPVDPISRHYSSSLSTVDGLSVSPSGEQIAVFGVLETDIEDFPTYALEILSLAEGSSVLADLPGGSVVAVAWMPDGEQLVAAMVPPVDSEGSVLDAPCAAPTALLFLTPQGEIVRTLEPAEPRDLGGGIAVVDDRSIVASALPPGTSCDPEARRLVRIDLYSGEVEVLGQEEGISGVVPVRGAGGVLFIRERRLRFLDLDSGTTRDIETPRVRVLDVAASSRSVVIFRGYEENTGEDAGLYAVDLAIGPDSVQFLFPTALNRLSLDHSGALLVGQRPDSPRDSYIAVIEVDDL